MAFGAFRDAVTTRNGKQVPPRAVLTLLMALVAALKKHGSSEEVVELDGQLCPSLSKTNPSQIVVHGFLLSWLVRSSSLAGRSNGREGGRRREKGPSIKRGMDEGKTA